MFKFITNASLIFNKYWWHYDVHYNRVWLCLEQRRGRVELTAQTISALLHYYNLERKLFINKLRNGIYVAFFTLLNIIWWQLNCLIYEWYVIFSFDTFSKNFIYILCHIYFDLLLLPWYRLWDTSLALQFKTFLRNVCLRKTKSLSLRW